MRLSLRHQGYAPPCFILLIGSGDRSGHPGALGLTRNAGAAAQAQIAEGHLSAPCRWVAVLQAGPALWTDEVIPVQALRDSSLTLSQGQRSPQLAWGFLWQGRARWPVLSAALESPTTGRCEGPGLA